MTSLLSLRDLTVSYDGGQSAVPAAVSVSGASLSGACLSAAASIGSIFRRSPGAPRAPASRPAVAGLSLDVRAGETVALVGESGCGKSTTALAILRLLPAAARVRGQILLDGRDLLALDERDMTGVRGSAAAMIFQEPMTSLNPVRTVGDQIVEALRLHLPISSRAAAARAVELLDQVRISEPARRFHAYPHQLSGGQRQRAMIAMAIACGPRLLIADEPTTALDVTVQSQILALLDDLRKELAMGVLLITHDLGLVAQWADRVAVMHDGIRVEEGDTASVLRSARHPYTRGLLAASLSQAAGGAGHAGLDSGGPHGGGAALADLHYRATRLPEIRIERGEDGAANAFRVERPPVRIPAAAIPVADAGEGPLLRVENLHVRHGSVSRHGAVHAVRGVSFAIGRGETVGLVGESGCGKSTLARALLRLSEVDDGRIEFDGVDLTRLDRRRMQPLRGAMQLVFQDPYGSLNPRRTVGDLLDSVQRMHGVRDSRERTARSAAMLDKVGLPASALRRYPHEFSGGQRQRIGIARALILRPRLLVCDEPVSALDVSVQAQVLNLLADLQAELGLSCLFISHDLNVVRYIADRVLVMRDGQLVESADRHALWTRPAHPYTRQLLDAVPRAA